MIVQTQKLRVNAILCDTISLQVILQFILLIDRTILMSSVVNLVNKLGLGRVNLST